MQTHLDLFSGIGGFALACRWLGIETIGFSEIDQNGTKRNSTIWQSESGIRRVANGIPKRVDRLRGLGNAIVPQVACQIIRMMIEAEESCDK